MSSCLNYFPLTTDCVDEEDKYEIIIIILLRNNGINRITSKTIRIVLLIINLIVSIVITI